MSFHDHFSGRAAQYAAARPTYPPELAAFLARVAPRTGLAWEVGCGSGQLTRDVARHFTRVVATDPSFAQLKHAPVLPTVSYQCALAEMSALRSNTADLCLAAQAAHWFDLERYYDEVRRVAREDGVVALISYGNLRIAPAINDIVHHFHVNVLGSYWPPERRHVDANYQTLAFPFEIIAAPSLQIEVAWSLNDFAGYVHTWSAVQALQKSEGDAKLRIFLNDLQDLWGDATSVKPVSWPLAIKVGKVR